MLKRAHLRHFIALAETGGFTAASRRLNLTQPTVSVSIAELERTIGVPLIERERRSIRLTQAGRRLLVLARGIEREFRTAETALGSGRTPLRPLTLGTLASISSAMLLRLRAAFGEGRPLVIIEGTDAELRRRFGAQQLDAVLTLLNPGEDARFSLEEDYVVLMSRRHPLAGRRDVAAEELSTETMVARRSCELLGETSRFFTARGVRPHFLMRSANEDRCLAMVRDGYAITTGPESLARDGIVAVRLRDYAYRRRVGVLERQDDGLGLGTVAWEGVFAEFQRG